MKPTLVRSNYIQLLCPKGLRVKAIHKEMYIVYNNYQNEVEISI